MCIRDSSKTADFTSATMVDVDAVDTSTTAHTFIDLTDGQVYYYRVRAGKVPTTVTAWSAAVSSTQDATSPTVTVSINSGDEYTTSASVLVTVVSNDAGTTPSGVAEYRLDAGAGMTSWTVVTDTITTLSMTLAADGLSTVTVEVRDNAGNVSAPASDDITLDTVAPVVTAATLLTAT